MDKVHHPLHCFGYNHFQSLPGWSVLVSTTLRLADCQLKSEQQLLLHEVAWHGMCEVQAERFAENEFGGLEKVLETDLMSFGKGFSVFEQVWLHAFVCCSMCLYP